MNKRPVLFLSLILCLLLSTGCASDARVIPDQVAPQFAAARVIVHKSERRLDLLDRQGNIMRSYVVSLGRHPQGKKIEENDGKTPEGVYTIDARNTKSDYYLSLRISYPSETDLHRAKKMCVRPGGKIFIHGSPNGKEWMDWKYTTKHDWTDGCIALSNDNMKEIWSLVPDGTPIVILP